jgi:hypothetical protein
VWASKYSFRISTCKVSSRVTALFGSDARVYRLGITCFATLGGFVSSEFPIVLIRTLMLPLSPSFLVMIR